jgi:hypothetical protein
LPAKAKGDTDDLPYRVADNFLSPAELSFLRTLQVVVNTQAVICPKVNLGDLFFIVDLKQNFRYRGMIAQKHVDFLLCVPDTMHPLVGIELDDSSHGRSDRQERDIFVDKVFQTAKLPLIHIPCRSSYDPAALAMQLKPYLEGTAIVPAAETQATQVQEGSVPASQSQPGPDAEPVCPKCGIPLVLRNSARGTFYGCSNYPRCRETKPVVSAR